MNGLERRRAPRFPVSVSIHQHVEGQTHRCRASNLSASGLYMERPLDTFVRHSAEVQLEIALPDGAEPLRAEAVIVYDCFDAMRHGTAVRFQRMSSEHRARLSAFLADDTSSRPATARA